MARRIRTLTKETPSAIVAFGDDSLTLRITQHYAPDAGGVPTNGRVAVTVNTGAAPAASLSNVDDDTRILAPSGLASEFTESAPGGAWDVRLALASGALAIVDLEEF